MRARLSYPLILSVSHSGSMRLLSAVLFDPSLMRVLDHQYSNYITWKRAFAKQCKFIATAKLPRCTFSVIFSFFLISAVIPNLKSLALESNVLTYLVSQPLLLFSLFLLFSVSKRIFKVMHIGYAEVCELFYYLPPNSLPTDEVGLLYKGPYIEFLILVWKEVQLSVATCRSINWS